MTAHSPRFDFALAPLASALLAALPFLAHAQTRPAVPVNQLPVPAAGWRVSGNGTWTANGANGVVDQQSAKGIYLWQSYNIGANASVTYQFKTTDGSALNRLVAGADPSQIFGKLTSTVPGTDGKPVTGGTVMLINPNGILFGKGAQVNTGALIASTLDLSDTEYLSGFSNSLNSTNPTFTHAGGAELFTDTRSFVLVDTDAQITTPNGGRIFLFAKNVENRGTLRTPGGQTVLGGGDAIYLNDPSAEKLYASEANPAVPALRGLLVEVGKTPGSVTNSGSIEVPRGNATLVGLAVNQNGRISATTSVSENGSVLLLARGNTLASQTESGTLTKRAQTGGQLVLGTGSRIEVLPDTNTGSDGKPATVDGNASFTASRIDMSGATVLLDRGSSIRAPGAVVNIRAEDTPNYTPATSFTATSSTARLAIGDGAVIDVSGTTDTTASVARNFVTTELLGGADLADSPLQRDGPLYRSKVTLDLRRDAPILADASVAAYRNAIRKTADELMSAGGSVNLSSQGSVVTHEGSRIDVSGGRVTFTEAEVKPTMLIAADGTRYSVNDAPKDILYKGIEGSPTGAQDRWGVVTQWLPQRQRIEAGYVQGQAAGNVNVLARDVVLDGSLKAATSPGVRQLSGTDALPPAGTLEIGRRVAGSNSFGSLAFANSAWVSDFTLAAKVGSLGADFWTDPMAGTAPSASHVAASRLNDSGFGQVFITSTGSITQESGADIALPVKGSLQLRASGEGGIALNGSVQGSGASVLAQTADLVSGQRRGDITLSAASRIDVAGNFSNRSLDANAPSAVAGGQVQLLSGHSLDLKQGSSIDVSGGATVNAAGTVSGTAAGRVALESNRSVSLTGDAIGDMRVSARLSGYGLSQGATLRLRAAEVDVVAADAGAALRNGSNATTLTLTDEFFTKGGFGSYDIEGAQRVQVHAGAQVAPRSDNWVASTMARNAVSGTRLASLVSTQRLPDAQRRPTNLSLSSGGLMLDGVDASGQLSLDAGARIAADAQAKVKLSANARLVVDGEINAAGGQVALALDGRGSTAFPANLLGFEGVFQVGSHANVDVSGTTLLAPTTDGTRTGRVVDAGSISLSVTSAQTGARHTPLMVSEGARLRADAVKDTLDVNVLGTAGSRLSRETVVGAAGSISITAQEGGANVQGSLQARRADASSIGGALLVAQGTSPLDASQGGVAEYRIDLSAAPTPSKRPAEGAVMISAGTINAGGFGDITLSTPQRMNFDGKLSLEAGKSLTVNATVVSATAGSDVMLAAPSVRLAAPVPAPALPAAAPASGGNARVVLAGGLVTLSGNQTLQGIGKFTTAAASRIELQGAVGSEKLWDAGLRTVADVTLSAPQTTLATNTRYTIDSPDHMVTFTEGRATDAPVMSAGASLTVNARDILQDGVVRAPLGSIEFNATRSLDIASGSVTSVSGDGLVVPVGTTSGGSQWTYLGTTPAQLPGKAIRLIAPDGQVNVAAGSTLDLSGGGKVLANEFVPGPGGSKDAFAGAAQGAFAIVKTVRDYGPHDAYIASLSDSTDAKVNIPSGRTITFGENGPVPAGTYAVLPARYALLSGAFLVTPAAGGARVDKGVAQVQPDGSVLVGASLGTAGTTAGSASTGFIVRTSAQAAKLSEVRSTDVDKLRTSDAKRAGSEVPRLAQDAGSLDLAARQLDISGNIRFDRAKEALKDQDARGGAVAITAGRIDVGDAPASTPGSLHLNTAQLNALGADSITLGALNQTADDGSHQLKVGASEVRIGASAQALQAQDIVVVATDRVALDSGARLTATGKGSAQALSVDGDGALVRVSADASASTVRKNTLQLSGKLDIAESAQLRGTSLTAESTAGTRIADKATLEASVFTIGAPRIAVLGSGATAPAATDTLVLSGALNTSLSQAQGATLRSFSGIDFIGDAVLGGPSLKKLTLDAGSLNVATPDAKVSVSAGDVQLTNTSGAAAIVQSGTGKLEVAALGGAGAKGDLTVGTGSLAVAGAQTTTLVTPRSIVLQGKGSLESAGDIELKANTLTASQGADATIGSSGKVTVSRPTGTDDSGSRAIAGAGASVTINSDRFVQNGSIDLPSGVLTVNASGASASGPTVLFDDGSITRLSGRSASFDGQQVSSSGGTLTLNAAQGDIRLVDPSVIDVSAGGAGASAGVVNLSAAKGRLTIDGALLATSQAGAGKGGTLRLDSSEAFNLDQLAGQIQLGRGTGLDNFSQRIEVRNRDGNQRLAEVTTLSAQNLLLTADNGSLEIAGTLDASGTQGGRIQVAASGDVTLSGKLLSRAGSEQLHGGDIQLMSQAGTVHLDRSAVVDASNGKGVADGSLLLRAQRTGLSTSTSPGTEVAVDALAGDLSRVGRIEVEAVKTYSSNVVNTALITKINDNNKAFAGVDGKNAAAIRSRLAGGDADLSSRISLRAGVEVRSNGAISVTGDTSLGGWNLTSFDAAGKPVRAGGEPMNLTIRAGGGLQVTGSISDGFAAGGSNPANPAAITPEATVIGSGARIRLVGGADLGAANPLATLANAGGDVTIGKNRTDVIVRSSTGSIDIAAGNDVKLANSQAVVYTTGKPVGGTSLPDYVGPSVQAGYILSGTNRQTPLLSGGGSVTVNAQRDVIGASETTMQYVTDWWWRNRTGDVASWWARYDKFKQGFGALGGGDVSVNAGRDAVMVQASAPNSGYLVVGGSATQLTGGRVDLLAGRDVLGGVLFAGGDQASVRAGGQIAASSGGNDLQVLHANTAVDIGARGDVRVGRVPEAGTVNAIVQWPGAQSAFKWWLGGTAADATLGIVSDAGNLVHSGKAPASSSSAITNATAQSIVPSRTIIAAPEGSVTLAEAQGLVQSPAANSSLTVAAARDVNFGAGSIYVRGSQPDLSSPRVVSLGESTELARDPFVIGANPFQAGATPVRIVARDGDFNFSQDVKVAAPLRITAGGDIVQGPGSGHLVAQHVSDGDLSLVRAGGDIRLTTTAVISSSTIAVHGPGDLVVMAGRDIDLGQSGGIAALGNRENAALPAASARLTILAGMAFDRGDYTQAVQRHVQLLGGNGIAGHAAELVSQLETLAAGGASGSTPAGATVSWNEMTPTARLDKALALSGQAAFDASLLRFVRQRSGDTTLDLAAARAIAAKYDATSQSALAANIVADQWLARTTPAQQLSAVLAMAGSKPYGDALKAFIAQQTGTAPVDMTAALQAYAALPIERQLLHLNGVLASDLRAAGRAASALTGKERDAAYLAGYEALAALFPSSGATANLEMGASQLKTLQGSGVTVLTPRGGVNVGALTASSTAKSSSELGIVTTAGGPITMAVKDTVAVNRSRVFTVGKGDLLIWASDGDIDAGRGAKTVTGAPPPVYRIVEGRVVVDTSSSYAGSGIAVLDASSTLDLYAPNGEINSGDAGIKSAGNAFLGAARFVGADNLQVGGVAVGAPPAPPAAGGTAGLAAAGQSATGAIGKTNADEDEDERRRKRRAKRDLLLDFLGFGDKS